MFFHKTQIVSPLNKDLTFKAHTGSIELIGNEGVLADAKQVTVTADQDIHFKVDQTVNVCFLLRLEFQNIFKYFVLKSVI